MSAYVCDRCQRYLLDDDHPMQLVTPAGSAEQSVCDDCANELIAQVEDGQLPSLRWGGTLYVGQKAV